MRFVLVVLAAVGLYALLDGALGSVAIGVGALLLLPILVFKIFLIMMVFGFIGRRLWGGEGPRRTGRSRANWSDGPRASTENRFEEWHRMAHAREEVDRWGPEVPGVEPE